MLTPGDLQFFIDQWGEDFTKETITKVASLTKNPRDETVLAIAVQTLLNRIKTLEAKVEALKSAGGGFEISPEDAPTAL